MEDLCLTTEELRSYDGLEDLTEEQAKQLSTFLSTFAIIVYEEMTKNKKNKRNHNKQDDE